MKWSRLFYLPLCAVMALSCLAGCGGNDDHKDDENKNDDDNNPVVEDVYQYVDYTAEHTATSRFVHFASADTGLDAFLNEYAERHMRDNAKTRVGDAAVGNTTQAAWREWDSLIGGWWDASSTNGTMSKNYATNDAVNGWLDIDSDEKFPSYRSIIDNQGYVWCNAARSIGSWGMGWDFPSYKQGGKAWDFASESEMNDWTVAPAAGLTAEVTRSKLQLKATASKVSEMQITTNNFNVEAKYTPFLRIAFSFDSTTQFDLDDLYVEWQTSDSPNWSQDKCVKFSDFSTRGYALGSEAVGQEDYAFPMYLNENWLENFYGDRTITALRITLKGKEPFRGTLGFDFIASDFDDRQVLNNCNYILAAKNNLEFSRDRELLEKVMPHARRAMNFMLNTLEGDSGLISTEYLVGHFSDGFHATGTGIGNGYWDVDAFPTVNLYCNISYYNALVAMKYLEDMAEGMDIPFEEVQTANAQMNGYDTYTAQTKESLEGLIATCKRRVQSEFWNEETGRFHVGYYDNDSNTVQDHGYTMFNEQVIASGLATEAQAKSVLSWINGERTVQGDDSTGEDIYRYEIAPRFNTHDIGSDFYFGYSCGWDGNVQNGGTALQLTYYDIVAQSFGNVQKAYSRLKSLQSWFEKVKAAGGEGKAFYRDYYNKYTDITLQGNYNGKDHSGLVGVDCEFLEAALLFRSVPDAFFGMSTQSYGVLNFAPSMPDGLDWWRIENLVYGGYYYDVAVGKYFVEVSGVGEYTNGSGQECELSVSFRVPSFRYAVYVNGSKTTSYSIENGKIVVQIPFENAKVEIREVV